MKLYYVSMKCRVEFDKNEHGVYGLKYGTKSGIMHVRAKSETEAKKKALAAVERGIEPYYVSQGGHTEPSAERVTFEFASVQGAPYIE